MPNDTDTMAVTISAAKYSSQDVMAVTCPFPNPWNQECDDASRGGVPSTEPCDRVPLQRRHDASDEETKKGEDSGSDHGADAKEDCAPHRHRTQTLLRVG